MSIDKLEAPESPESERMEALKALFPEVFADGRINLEALREALPEAVEDDEAAEEHYGLTWPGKRAAKKLATLPPTGTLVPMLGEGANEDTTKNVYIEGDNLEVLRILQKSYAGRVKMIFIDPPYNTGQDRIYKDDFKEPVDIYLRKSGQADDDGLLTSNPKSSGRYHSNWLSMMYPRLRLARNLLRDDGVIFISIDDNEQARLRLICDEIFGEENFVANFVWQSKDTPGNDSSSVAETHNHILSFRKSNIFKANLLDRNDKQTATYKNPDNDPRGPWLATPLTRNEYRERDYYPLTNPNGQKVYPPPGTCWRRPKEVLAALITDNRIWWGKSGTATFPMEKKFLSEAKPGVVNQTWWSYEFAGSTRNANAEIKELFDGARPFDTPKPTKLIRRLIQLSTNTGEDIIVDFFSGSATTAHAVLQMNIDDGGNRKFIMVQLPEAYEESNIEHKGIFKTIADIGRERIRRAISAIIMDNHGFDGDVGFRAYRLTTTSRKPNTAREAQSLTQMEDLFDGTLKPNWKPDEVISEMMLTEGFPLDSEKEQDAVYVKNQVWSITHPEIGHSLLICLDENLDPNTVERLSQETREDVFICLDHALTDQVKLTLADALRVKTL